MARPTTNSDEPIKGGAEAVEKVYSDLQSKAESARDKESLPKVNLRDRFNIKFKENVGGYQAGKVYQVSETMAKVYIDKMGKAEKA